MSNKAKTDFSISLPTDLYNKVLDLCKLRELTIEEVIRVYLRCMVQSTAAGKALLLSDVMPFGKYKDENVEVVIKTDPNYIMWLVNNSDNFKLATDAAELLLDITEDDNEVV